MNLHGRSSPSTYVFTFLTNLDARDLALAAATDAQEADGTCFVSSRSSSLIASPRRRRRTLEVYTPWC